MTEIAQVWVDFEATGIDEQLDPIIEAGVIYTDADLNIIAERSVYVELTQAGRARLLATPFVFDMHSKSGLLAALNDPEVEKLTIAELDDLIMSDLEAHGYNKRLRFGGSGSTGYDFYFAKAQLPRFGQLLHVFNQEDVRYVRNAYKQRIGTEVPGEYHSRKTHRAIEDIRLHLAEYKAYSEVLEAGARALGYVAN